MRLANEFFIPEIAQRRCYFNYDGSVLLILDGFGVHLCEDFDELCHENNIFLQLFPAHSSNQLQFLDLGIFGIQKRWMSNITIPYNDMNPHSKLLNFMIVLHS